MYSEFRILAGGVATLAGAGAPRGAWEPHKGSLKYRDVGIA